MFLIVLISKIKHLKMEYNLGTHLKNSFWVGSDPNFTNLKNSFWVGYGPLKL